MYITVNTRVLDPGGLRSYRLKFPNFSIDKSDKIISSHVINLDKTSFDFFASIFLGDFGRYGR